MSNYITAIEGAELISPFVGLCPKTEKDELFQLLSLAQTKAWKKGIFKGMVKDFNVNIRKRTINGVDRSFMITPHGYEVLLAVNLDGKPKYIRDNYFQFNPEGSGSVSNCSSRNWTDDVIDLGSQPTLFQPCENKCNCGDLDCNSRALGVIGYKCEKSCETDSDTVLISGINNLNNPVYTYEPDDVSSERHSLCRCVSPDERANSKQRKVIDGDIYPIKPKLVIHKNIKWNRIDSIRKGYTNGPVEVFAVCGNSTELLARIEPFQKVPNYRIYELPDCCCDYECVHGLFKIGKPDPILSDFQHLVIDDDEALIALTKSLNLTYRQEKLELGEAFLHKGMMNLDEEHKMNRSNARVPIIVDGVSESNEYLEWS